VKKKKNTFREKNIFEKKIFSELKKTMALLVCDSSSLISLNESCLLASLDFLKRSSHSEFRIPPEVMRETVQRPLKIRRFEYSAIRLNHLLQEGIVKLCEFPDTRKLTEEFLALSNSLFSVQGRPLQLVQRGEAECLAVYARAGAAALLIDEKTTRLLIESPQTLLNKISGEYEDKIEVNQRALEEWRKKTSGIFVMRSSELLAIAVSKGFFKPYRSLEREALHAALYAVRNAGCSVSEEEMRQEAEYPFIAQK